MTLQVDQLLTKSSTFIIKNFDLFFSCDVDRKSKSALESSGVIKNTKCICSLQFSSQKERMFVKSRKASKAKQMKVSTE